MFFESPPLLGEETRNWFALFAEELGGAVNPWAVFGFRGFAEPRLGVPEDGAHVLGDQDVVVD